ncbi:MAG: polysaccharide deacetylase family protein [Solirubrobacterales bacterium]|nr:polysaccharide deacetylase family protein [Solirubrobacterales bacterium]MBV9796864.1 polysaccharide deacetylase family protein [Solirubrobacterales bacterium]
MNLGGRRNPSRSAGFPLSPAERSARRVAWRRRRARRRAGLIVVLVAGLVLVGGLVVKGQISKNGGAASTSAQTAAHANSAKAGSAGQRTVALAAAHHGPSLAKLAATTEAHAVNRALGYASYARLLTHRRREVALTFDDGPSPYTPEIIRTLRRMHAGGTFFTIGRSIGIYPHFVAEEARDGFDVGDHTETHPPLSALSPGAQAEQISEAAAAIQRAGAPYPRLMRPPYGSFDAETLGILKAQRMLMVLWSVDTSDYIRPGVARIVDTAVSGATPGAIILMHDGGGNRSETVAALPRIITLLRRRGYRLVTVGQLIRDDPPPRNQPPPQPLSGAI